MTMRLEQITKACSPRPRKRRTHTFHSDEELLDALKQYLEDVRTNTICIEENDDQLEHYGKS